MQTSSQASSLSSDNLWQCVSRLQFVHMRPIKEKCDDAENMKSISDSGNISIKIGGMGLFENKLFSSPPRVTNTLSSDQKCFFPADLWYISCKMVLDFRAQEVPVLRLRKMPLLFINTLLYFTIIILPPTIRRVYPESETD